MLIATGEFLLAKEFLDEASHFADVAPQNWVKPELYRLYAVLAEHPAGSGDLTMDYWLKQSFMQAYEHGEKYAELCAARDLGQFYACRGEHQKALRFSLPSPAAL
jgi:hypothetical protein